MGKVQHILKDSHYGLDIFSQNEIDWLENRIVDTEKTTEKTKVLCFIRNKEISLTPEEITRQLYLHKLVTEYAYPKHRIALEHGVSFGRQTKRADIVVFDKDRKDTPYIIIEVKKPKLTDGKEQLKSYCNATGAPLAVWTNGGSLSHYNRKDPNYFADITNIPKANETIEDILNTRFTWKDLVIEDEIPKLNKTLKGKIKELEDEVLANAGVDVFEEVFKLLFTKLYDEYQSREDKLFLDRSLKNTNGLNFYELCDKLQDFDDTDFRKMAFRNTGQTEFELKDKIQKLFDRAKSQWKGVFDTNSSIALTPSHLSICVSSLQNIKLFNSNLQVVDEAFEYLVNKTSKGEKGQFFTPRHVIDMCVQMLQPKAGEYVIDTASGSCGFPIHSIFHITGHLFEAHNIPESERENVLKVFGIDFDEKTVRIARMLNMIAGDGNTNVLHLNTLDYDRWSDFTNLPEWQHTYSDVWHRLQQLKNLDGAENQKFNFDVLLANPPFAGDIKESRILNRYNVTFKDTGKMKSKVGRDILFIERNLDFVRPGGRLALVLPQGRFNNTTDKDIREYIMQHARILAVVGLDVNTFKPHTGTKTSVLFLQKWDDTDCPKVDDYPIFFATSEKSGKNNSGDYVHKINADGSYKLDKHHHNIVDHDLHNHNGELSDGIAEAFLEFAREQGFSFV